MTRILERNLLVLGLIVALPGCADTLRNVGAGAVGVGALTATAGVVVAGGCHVFSSDDDSEPASSEDCEDRGELAPNPRVGVPLLGVGLAVLLAGGILWGLSEPTPSQTSPPPAPPRGTPY